MLVRLFDKIAGVPAGTIKNLPRGVASAIVAKGYGELVDDPKPATEKAEKPKKETKSKNKIAKR